MSLKFAPYYGLKFNKLASAAYVITILFLPCLWQVSKLDIRNTLKLMDYSFKHPANHKYLPSCNQSCISKFNGLHDDSFSFVRAVFKVELEECIQVVKWFVLCIFAYHFMFLTNFGVHCTFGCKGQTLVFHGAHLRGSFHASQAADVPAAMQQKRSFDWSSNIYWKFILFIGHFIFKSNPDCKGSSFWICLISQRGSLLMVRGEVLSLQLYKRRLRLNVCFNLHQ